MPISDSRYGVGNPEDPIHAGGLDCVGTETSLSQCSSTGPSGCTHASDAGLECQPSKCMHISLYFDDMQASCGNIQISNVFYL